MRRLFIAVTALVLLEQDAAGKDRLYQPPGATEGRTVAQWVERLKAKEEKDRFEAAFGLEVAGREAEAAVPALAEALSDPSARVRREAADVLSLIGPAAVAAAPALAARLALEKDAQTLDSTVSAIGFIGPGAAPVAIPALVKLIPNLRTLSRMRALGAFARFKQAGAPATEFLIEWLAHGDGAGEAASGLGAIGPAAKAAVPALRALRDVATGWDLIDAAAALVRITEDPAEGVPTLEILVDSPDERFRAAAVSRIPAPAPRADAFVPALVRALADSSREVRGRATDMLGQLGPAAASATSVLVKALGDPSESLRNRSAKALGDIGPPAASAIPALRAMLARKEDPLGQVLAIHGLHGITGETTEHLSSLLAALGSPEWLVRACAAEELGRWGSAAKSTIPALEHAADDDQAIVREEARGAIAHIRAK